MRRPELLLCVWILLLGAAAKAKIHGNPANDLVALINGKRAASKLPALRNSAGLGCMALQYISECMASSCSGSTVACQPPEAHITEVYAANCGVELPTVDIISGRLIGCAGTEDELQQAVLAVAANTTNGTATVIRGREHTQVGAGLENRRRGPFFWCLLFSSGSANSTFLLEAGGKGIPQTHGCFSAPDRTSCNAAPPRLAGAGAGAAAALLHLRLRPGQDPAGTRSILSVSGTSKEAIWLATAAQCAGSSSCSASGYCCWGPPQRQRSMVS